ncbi:unnamed protein product [Paramecium octaurelia]|uniref:Uncharacterized protein n=1 Tax=Paramecium octaurelia TaxID=43137 RepID=A0A8S1UN89_PAROT|nr:unnamed protein product [Paramecium octaurelia]
MAPEIVIKNITVPTCQYLGFWNCHLLFNSKKKVNSHSKAQRIMNYFN